MQSIGTKKIEFIFYKIGIESKIKLYTMSNSSSSGPSVAGDSVRTIEETLAALRAERLRIDTEYKKADVERQALERSLTVACRASAGLRSKWSELEKAVCDAEVALKDATFSSEAETIDKPTLIKMFDTVKTFPQFLKCYELLTAKHGVTDPNCVLTYGSLFFTILHHCEDLQERLKILSYLVEKGADPMLVPDGAEWSRHFANVSNSCPRDCDKETLETYLRCVYATFQMALAKFKTDLSLEEGDLFLQVVIYEILPQAKCYDAKFRTSPEWLDRLQIDIRRLFHNMYDQLLAAIRAHPSTLVQGRACELTGPDWDRWKQDLRILSKT